MPRKYQTVIIQWLSEDNEPCGPKQAWPKKAIKGHIVVGGNVLATNEGKDYAARIISLGRLAGCGVAPASSTPAPVPRARSSDDPDFQPSEDSSSDDEISTMQQKKSTKSQNQLPLPQPAESDPGSDQFEIVQVTVEEGSPHPTGTRWRVKQPTGQTTKQQKKYKRKSGQEFTDNKGTVHPPKAPKPITEHYPKCRFNCSHRFSDEDRKFICNSFWGLADYQRQHDFISQCVVQGEVENRREETTGEHPRNISNAFYLPVDGGMKIRVCKWFFLNTLCISNNKVLVALKSKSVAGHFDGDDHRGKHEPAHKIPEEDKLFIKAHIESFPVVESHYVRKGTRRQFLEASLSLSKMYDLYKEKCTQENRKIYSMSKYSSVFGTEFNLGFHKPKKDRCAMCDRFETAVGEEKDNLQEEYESHIERKESCQNAKAAAKERAIADEHKSFVTATFDLQSVLQLPSSDVSSMYYKRKLCVYNLTVYDGATKDAHCFYWNETDGKRGSSEIGSCLLEYIQELPDTVRHVSFFSDSCGGQNRNQYVMLLMLNTVQTIPNLEIIELNYLQPGHTQMECDSMHSAIEQTKKHTKVYLMNDWENLFKLARRKNPYKVHRLEHGSFYDLKQLAGAGLNIKNGDEGEKVRWLSIKRIQLRKNDPNAMYYAYDHNSDLKRVTLRSRKRGRPSMPNLEKLYDGPQPMSQAKKKDLLELCRTGAIPKVYHKFYEDLPSSPRSRDIDCISEEDSD